MSCKKFITLVIIMLAAGAAWAQDDPRKIGAMESVAKNTWEIEPLNQTLAQAVTVTGIVPVSEDWQETHTNATHPFQWENGRIVFDIYASGKTEITAITAVKSGYQDSRITNKADYPLDVPEEIEGYTKETPLARITLEISEKARELAANSTDELEIIARLVEWTHNSIKYDPGLGAVNYSSEWVYLHRRGTCDEFSNLLIALCRSLGIPARFVSGYINTGDEWGTHGWVEAWVPEKGWIPADPAFNEILVLDATHVKLAQAADQTMLKDTLKWSVLGSAFSFSKNYSLEETSSQPFAEKFEITVDMPNQTGQTQEIRATVKNTQDSYAFAPLLLIIPTEAKTDEPVERMVYLKPLEEKQVAWKAALPDMKENVLYTFPIKIETQGTSRTAVFQRIVYVAKPTEKIPPEAYGLGTTENIPTTFKLFLAIILIVTVAAVAVAVWQQREKKRL